MGLITTPASVRHELSQKFDALPIFKRDRASALYHLAVALEMSTYPYTVNPDLVMAIGRRVLEASNACHPRNQAQLSDDFLGVSCPIQPGNFRGS